jgi:hypothetical protein
MIRVKVANFRSLAASQDWAGWSLALHCSTWQPLHKAWGLSSSSRLQLLQVQPWSQTVTGLMAAGVEEGKAIHVILARENPFQEFGANIGVSCTTLSWSSSSAFSRGNDCSLIVFLLIQPL